MDPAAVVLRPMPAVPPSPDIIAIGSSTGGPQALFEVLSHLKGGVRQPILITQHMPATFTTILAEHITRQCGMPCAEAKDGEPLVGGPHLSGARRLPHGAGDQGRQHGAVGSTRTRRRISAAPRSIPMLRSIAKIYGKRALAVILTGMGQDGMRGCTELVAAGGLTIAQDEATSVVWGMPGAVATAGLCSAVLPLPEIGPFIRKIASRTAA